MLAMGYAGYAAPPRRSLVAVTVAVAGLRRHRRWRCTGFAWDTVFFPAVFYPARWAGRLVSREQERSAQLVELTAQLDAQRESAAQAAAQEERTRIAREVHDAVAHSVSVMTLQIGGLRRQLGRRARGPAGGARRHARARAAGPRDRRGAALAGRHPAGARPTESLDRAGALAVPGRRRWSATSGPPGSTSSWRCAATPRELPRALDLSAYRILQEALTNVLRHAPGSRARVPV